jgi:hypothetical protein
MTVIWPFLAALVNFDFSVFIPAVSEDGTKRGRGSGLTQVCAPALGLFGFSVKDGYGS